MSKSVINFIKELVLNFGEPKFDVPDSDKRKAYDEWLRGAVRELSPYSDDSLEKAKQIIVASRKYRSFPLIAECLDACKEAQRWLRAQKPELGLGGKLDTRKIPEWSNDRERLADDLVRCDLGRRASHEGWVSALHDFCRRELRLPVGPEIKRCIDDAKGVDEWIERAARGECGAQSKVVVMLGQSKLKRRDEIKDMVLHGVVRG